MSDSTQPFVIPLAIQSVLLYYILQVCFWYWSGRSGCQVWERDELLNCDPCWELLILSLDCHCVAAVIYCNCYEDEHVAAGGFIVWRRHTYAAPLHEGLMLTFVLEYSPDSRHPLIMKREYN